MGESETPVGPLPSEIPLPQALCVRREGERGRPGAQTLLHFIHRTASHRVRVGEQLHPENVSFSVRQSEQLHVLHRVLPRKVGAGALHASPGQAAGDRVLRGHCLGLVRKALL